MRKGLWLEAAAIGTWLVCGIPALGAVARGTFAGPAAALWAAAFALYGLSLVAVLRRRSLQPWHRVPALVFVSLQSITATVINAAAAASLGSTGAGIALFVIVAAELPHLLPARATGIWVALQTAAMTVLLLGRDNPANVISFGLAIGGFQAFAVISTYLMLSETAARQQLALAHGELLGTRALLAESSRVDERLRISRDLHDTLGHHLTALSLQLDVAGRLAGEPAVTHVRQAHAIARLLLADVRGVVSDLRAGADVDIAGALRALKLPDAALRIHLDVPETVPLESSARGEAVLRALQEMITNALKHSHACNLWIAVRCTPDGVLLSARDDGNGADAVTPGNGLTGMRERFEQHAGRLEIRTRQHHGFELEAFLPRVQRS